MSDDRRLCTSGDTYFSFYVLVQQHKQLPLSVTRINFYNLLFPKSTFSMDTVSDYRNLSDSIAYFNCVSLTHEADHLG